MSSVPERLCKNEEILAKLVDGEAILVNPSNGMYYSMDRVAAAAWEMIEQGHRLDDVAGALARRYEVTPEQARADLDKLVNELLEAELVRDASGDASPAPLDASVAASRLPYASPELVSYSDLGDLLALDPPAPSFGDVAWDE